MSEFKLTFDVLRAANTMRLPLFRDAKGNIAHPHPTGADWSPGEWVCAVTGELGELANIIKKVRRGDVAVADVRDEIANELADVACYLDILALQFGVDLGDAVATKFNKVSQRVRAPVVILPPLKREGLPVRVLNEDTRIASFEV